jgi:hypothetical protein
MQPNSGSRRGEVAKWVFLTTLVAVIAIIVLHLIGH